MQTLQLMIPQENRHTLTLRLLLNLVAGRLGRVFGQLSRVLEVDVTERQRPLAFASALY